MFGIGCDKCIARARHWPLDGTLACGASVDLACDASVDLAGDAVVESWTLGELMVMIVVGRNASL